MDMRYCLDNKKVGIRWEAFEAPLHCADIYSIGVVDFIRSQQSSYGSYEETHPGQFELHYVGRGMRMFRVGDSIASLRPGELFIALPGQIHGSLHGIVGPSTTYWVRFPADFSAKFAPAEAQLITDHLQSISGQPCIENREVLRPLMDGILGLLRTSLAGPAQRFALEQLSTALIASLLQVVPRKNRTARHPVFVEKVCRVIKDINDAPEQAHHVPSMAKECGVCETLFRSLFKEITGLAPVDYVHFIRTEKAKTLLMQGIPSTTIAYDLGYSSPPHFCAVFSKWTGSAPSQYLKNMAKPAKIVSRSSDKPVYDTLQRRYGC